MIKIMKEESFKIKLIEQKDLSRFINLWNQNYKLLTSSGFLMTKKKAEEGFKKKMFDYFGLYQNNQLIGFCLLSEENVLWIKHFLIDKNFRKKGLGSLFLKNVITVIKKKNKNIKIEVLNDNQIALKFFIRNDFRIFNFDKRKKQYILIYKTIK